MYVGYRSFDHDESTCVTRLSETALAAASRRQAAYSARCAGLVQDAGAAGAGSLERVANLVPHRTGRSLCKCREARSTCYSSCC